MEEVEARRRVRRYLHRKYMSRWRWFWCAWWALKARVR